MSKKRVLFVSQEMNPYTTLTEISAIVKKLAPLTQSKDMEVRVLMPKYGSINERRHRLHEVCLLYTSPSPRDATLSRMPSSA